MEPSAVERAEMVAEEPRFDYSPGMLNLRRIETLFVAAVTLLIALTASACEAVPDSCNESFTAPEEAPSVDLPDAYFSGMRRPTDGGLFLVELVRSSPIPAFTDDYSWKIRIRDSACVERTDFAVDAEPTMPQHGHGTTPEFTPGLPDTAGQYHFNEMRLFMPGVWQIEFTITDTDGTSDTVSWFFDLEG